MASITICAARMKTVSFCADVNKQSRFAWRYPEFRNLKLIVTLLAWSFKMCYNADLMDKEKYVLTLELAKGKNKKGGYRKSGRHVSSNCVEFCWWSFIEREIWCSGWRTSLGHRRKRVWTPVVLLRSLWDEYPWKDMNLLIPLSMGSIVLHIELWQGVIVSGFQKQDAAVLM